MALHVPSLVTVLKRFHALDSVCKVLSTYVHVYVYTLYIHAYTCVACYITLSKDTILTDYRTHNIVYFCDVCTTYVHYVPTYVHCIYTHRLLLSRRFIRVGR